MNKLINGEIPSDRSQQAFNGRFITIDVEKTTNDLRCPNRINPLHINLDELGEAILVKVKNEIMHEIKSIANNDEWMLVWEFCLLKEVLDLLRIVVVTFSTDSFDLVNLASASGGLNVLEMNLGIFAEIDNRSEVVI